MKTLFKIAAVALILAFALLAVVAQIPTNDVPPFESTPFDQKVRDAFANLSAWQFLLAPLTLIIVAGLKKGLKKIPDGALPWIAPIIAAILDQVGSKAGWWTGNLAVGASMGGLATWAHQTLVKPFNDDEETTTTVPMILLIGALAFSPVAFTGCGVFGIGGKATAEARRYYALSDTWTMTHKSYQGWTDIVELGKAGRGKKVSASNEAKVDASWNTFRAAYVTAVDSAANNGAAPTPDNVARLSAEFVTLVNSLSQ